MDGWALVTGGSRGIGRAVSERLARDGRNIVLTWRSAEAEAEAVADRIRADGRQVRTIRLDLGDRESVKALVAGLQDVDLELLVNSAGMIRDGLLAFQSDEDLRELVEVNLLGVIGLTRGLLRGFLRRRSGRILNIVSGAALAGNKGQTGYSAAKAGMVAFSKSLAREVAQFGVRVNAIAPGFVETEILSELPEKTRLTATAAIPLGRFGRPEEVAGVVSWLSSPASDYVTGAVIRVDGGLLS